MDASWTQLIMPLLGGGVLGGLITAFFQYLTAQPKKQKRRTEKTLRGAS